MPVKTILYNRAVKTRNVVKYYMNLLKDNSAKKELKMAEKSRLRTTKRQLEAMITFIECNKELGSNRKTSNAERDPNLSKWEKLKTMLNGLDGPVRTTKEWKQVFSDLKTNTRRRARQKKYDLKRTGGGKANEKDLSELEERVLNIESKITIDGMPDIGEPGLPVTVEEPSPEIRIIDFPEALESVESTITENTITEKPCPQDINKKRRKIKRPAADTTGDMKNLIQSQENMAAAINNLARSVVILAKKLR